MAGDDHRPPARPASAASCPSASRCRTSSPAGSTSTPPSSGSSTSDAVTLGETFANYAAVALANAYLYSTTAALAEQMAAAMESRAVIEQAKGILMARQSISADDAFALLARASQTSNRKLRDIAAGIVSGTVPEDGKPRLTVPGSASAHQAGPARVSPRASASRSAWRCRATTSSTHCWSSRAVSRAAPRTGWSSPTSGGARRPALRRRD